MAQFRTVTVSNVDELLQEELPPLQKAARRIAAQLRGLHPSIQGSIKIKVEVCVHDPRRRETVHLERKAWENVGRRQARGVE